MSVRSSTNAGLRVATALALFLGGGVLAVEEVALTLERIEGGSWSARDVTIDVELAAESIAAKLHIREASIPGVKEPLRDLSIECAALEMSASAYRCRRASIRFSAPQLGRQRVAADVRYERASGALDIDMHGLRVGQGAIAATLALRKKDWRARISLEASQASALVKLAETYAQIEMPLSAEAGVVMGSTSLHGDGSGVDHAELDVRVESLTSNNASGSIATDKLSAHVLATMQRARAGWRFSAEVRSHAGQGYVEPIFLDLGARNVAATARGVFESSSRLTFDAFTIEHAQVVQARGSAMIDFTQDQPLRTFDLELGALHFPGAYESYLQPWLLDTSFKSMQTRGVISGRMQWENGAPQSAELDFDRVAFDDGAQQLALNELTGRFIWRSAEDSDQEPESQLQAGVGPSNLQWSGGSILGLEIGPARVSFSTEGRAFRLLAPARIPLLDGAVDLESFRVRSAGTPKVAFLVDARIEPISVERLCKAFGWPEFGGRIGGEISKLRMREGVVTLGATLRAEVFDGGVGIADLRLEEPFGKWPRLHASIGLTNLDLELVTRAFSFGRITGRLSGRIEDLELFNWSPVAFDARFYTPADDRSRRRISQRAVQNLGNIGGGGAGVTAALSSGFLRFFDDFNYERLGLSCRLRNEVCEMGGVGPAPNGGYYLVKGKGVPRIDVIGNARRVDWPRLVQQLIAITESEGPVVQ